jgi:VanZ family protein
LFQKVISFLADHRYKFVYVPLLVYWFIIFIGTTLPSSQLPNIGPLSDKAKHFIAYFLLSVMLDFALSFQKKKPWLSKYSNFFTFIIVALYGILDEIHQSFIPGRSCDINDWYADISGAFLGMILAFLLKKSAFCNRPPKEETF